MGTIVGEGGHPDHVLWEKGGRLDHCGGKELYISTRTTVGGKEGTWTTPSLELHSGPIGHSDHCGGKEGTRTMHSFPPQWSEGTLIIVRGRRALEPLWGEGGHSDHWLRFLSADIP